MATVANSHQFYCRDNNFLIEKGNRQNKKRHLLFDAVSPPMKRKGNDEYMLDFMAHDPSVLLGKHKLTHRCTSYITQRKGKPCTSIRSLSSAEKHLESLDTFLRKLHNDARQPSLSSLNQMTDSVTSSDKFKTENRLRSLVDFFGKVDEGVTSRYISSASDGENLQASSNTAFDGDDESGRGRTLNNYMELKPEAIEGSQKSADNVSDFYLIGVLASINIAVFLIEIATPIKNSNFELFSLPLVYGAKINNLILMGEWWRLVTPIFLHSGIFHIALGSWFLFIFGLEVSQKYGSFTFLLIYILGGFSGNLISFLHTPEPTVGGTGPVFALIGAWLIYQVQNRDVIATEASKSMFQKAIIFTVLSFVLSNFGPIDDWSHFGAAFTGIVYGFFTCPSLQVKDASSDIGQEERMTLVRRYADPCKTLMYFSFFLLLLSSLLLIIEPPLYLLLI
ncbi:RHOMBOID 9, chloroplastic [Olea europaea subsp. europaea]|uniref:RHOMBOID 9, chloroplastic n=2 Tax=Olea europaea subsp. europaea TaxID=158383 RepID=A0A8S0RYJ5_OLEEU|nr:RHOMBOID 9, chloroplastic [Olea europaea subsp. europaea]